MRPHSRTADAAYYATAALAMQYYEYKAGVSSYNQSVITAAESAYAFCGRQNPKSLIKMTIEDMYNRYHEIRPDYEDARHIQKLITACIEENKHQLLREKGNDSDRARLTALQQPNAMLTERVSRSLFIYNSSLPDSTAVHRNRMILGMPPSETVQRCMCGMDLDSRHAVSCIKTRKICAESRHDMVRDELSYSLNRYNIHSKLEYRTISHSIENGKEKRIRPDGFTPIMNELWDIAVVNPACQSYIDKGSDTKGLKAAETMEKHKITKYKSVAEKDGNRFTPLVFESFGGFGPSVRDFISRAADIGVQVSGIGVLETHEMKHDIRCSLAFALVHGNARLIINALRLAEQRAPRVVPRGGGRGRRPLVVVRRPAFYHASN